jgi:hypothetical protein
MRFHCQRAAVRADTSRDAVLQRDAIQEKNKNKKIKK